MNYPILLVDDDPLFLDVTQLLLSQNGFSVERCSDADSAIALLAANPRKYAIILLDFRLGDVAGDTVAQAIRKVTETPYILICSGDPSREAVKLSWQSGAVGFIEKGGDPEAFLSDITGWYRKFLDTRAELDVTLAGAAPSAIHSCGWVGCSESLNRVAEKVLRYRNSPSSVLITGETGTGKELVARGLVAPGKEKTFFAVNCAAYQGNAELLESELFGYERGAFTGADRDRPGIFEMASGGTVFLDEIHHLSLAAQAKLLRACQERRLRRVGGAKEYPANFRLIAASKPEIESLCEQGKFLADLYHRIHVLRIDVPPLRERREDIPVLVAHFVDLHGQRTGIQYKVLVRTLEYLERYSWPGNVRELQNAVERMLADAPDETILPEHLDRRFFEAEPVPFASSYSELREKQILEQRTFISEVLKTSRSKAHAAERLQISPTTLQSILKRLSLEASQQREQSDVR